MVRKSNLFWTEKVYVWRLDGSPPGTMGDSDDWFKVLIVTTSAKITVEQFPKLLKAAFTDQGRGGFVGSEVFNKLVKLILAPEKKGVKRSVPTFKYDLNTGFHLWRWELLGDASLRLGTGV